MATRLFDLYLTILCVVLGHPLRGWSEMVFEAPGISAVWTERRCPCGSTFELASMEVEIDDEEAGTSNVMNGWLG
jgi:hypothetical protein